MLTQNVNALTLIKTASRIVATAGRVLDAWLSKKKS
jgi:hypothetical protein